MPRNRQATDKTRNVRKSRIEILKALETFVRGHCVGRSLTHPCEYEQLGEIWLMRDAPRPNGKDYRKEEYISYETPPTIVDALARQNTQGRYFVGDLVAIDASTNERRAEFKNLGYRLIITEPLFVHSLTRIPRPLKSGEARIELLRSAEVAVKLGKATRSRPLDKKFFNRSGPFRQYVALSSGEDVVGWVRSVPAGHSNWCSNLAVQPKYRRQGIASLLLNQMLRDDRQWGVASNVLLASHSGAKLYPQLGYQMLGTLYVYAPRRP